MHVEILLCRVNLLRRFELGRSPLRPSDAFPVLLIPGCEQRRLLQILKPVLALERKRDAALSVRFRLLVDAAAPRLQQGHRGLDLPGGDVSECEAVAPRCTVRRTRGRLFEDRQCPVAVALYEGMREKHDVGETLGVLSRAPVGRNSSELCDGRVDEVRVVRRETSRAKSRDDLDARVLLLETDVSLP